MKKVQNDNIRRIPRCDKCGSFWERWGASWRPTCICCPNAVFHAHCDEGIESDHLACDSCAWHWTSQGSMRSIELMMEFQKKYPKAGNDQLLSELCIVIRNEGRKEGVVAGLLKI